MVGRPVLLNRAMVMITRESLVHVSYAEEMVVGCQGFVSVKSQQKTQI